MESNDTFKSLSSVTQLVLDALLEQQIEKLKYLSALQESDCRQHRSVAEYALHVHQTHA
jgi:hypothetical protein